MAEATRCIAIVCPGGPIKEQLARDVEAIATAKFSGRVDLQFHSQCFAVEGHFAGADALRSAAFLEVANDPQFSAVWFGRGGYGACRLDDALFVQLNDAARRKTYLGYSDNGAILARLYALGIGRPVHGPIATDLSRESGAVAIERSLRFLTTGAAGDCEPTTQDNRPVAAFNITVLASLASAPWMPDLKGHIVLLEDVGEYLYRIDRSFSAIMNAPFMKEIAGIKLGRIGNVPENDRPFGQSAEEIAQYWCARFEVPYLGRADIGHDSDNKIVPFGSARIS